MVEDTPTSQRSQAETPQYMMAMPCGETALLTQRDACIFVHTGARQTLASLFPNDIYEAYLRIA